VKTLRNKTHVKNTDNKKTKQQRYVNDITGMYRLPISLTL